MPKYTTTLLSHEQIAEGTMAFHFVKPEQFSFVAGQNVDMFLINPLETDAEGNKRTFSLASTPTEDRITIATRMRNTAFKRVLGSLKPGESVELDGPYGDVMLHNNVEKTAVFLAGGIGITLFRSMVLDADQRHLAHKIFLFYSNHRPEDAPFLEDLQNIQNPNYRFIGTMTNMENSKAEWTGETGYINKAMLERYLPDLTTPIYYIAGPPKMVSSLKEMLITAGVDTDNIRIEEFAGY